MKTGRLSFVMSFFLENLFLSSVSSSAQGEAMAPVPPPTGYVPACGRGENVV